MRAEKRYRLIALSITSLLLFVPLSITALTITTFNILAPVHRSMKDHLLGEDEEECRGGTMKQPPRRESEREDWWLPRAKGVANYISKKFSLSDVILLQEWWFDDKFSAVFDLAWGGAFERCTERRPSGGGDDGVVGQTMRDDGMCCLVRKKGNLELIKSSKIVTGPQRIAQIIQCKERGSFGEGRHVFIANSHLSFPGDIDPRVNDLRQANEVRLILEALIKAGNQCDTLSPENERLEVICGDFNSNSCGIAASLVESPPYNFVNCASAAAEQMLTHIGGQVNLGFTHCDHLGQMVSVDHIFLRSVKTTERSCDDDDDDVAVHQEVGNRCSALALGFLDSKGTRILNVRSDNIHLEGSTVLSDHRPVTAKIAWPRANKPKKEILSSELYANVTRPLDPLEPAWGIVEE